MTTMTHLGYLKVTKLFCLIYKLDAIATVPLLGLYLAEFKALAETSLSDSDPRVSYSVMGM